MSNIYLKTTTEKNWRSQNFDFLSLNVELFHGLKYLSPGQLLGAPTHEDIIEF